MKNPFRIVIFSLALMSLGLISESLFSSPVAQGAAVLDATPPGATPSATGTTRPREGDGEHTATPSATGTTRPRDGERTVTPSATGTPRPKESDKSDNDKNKEKERANKGTFSGEVSAKGAGTFTLKLRNGQTITFLVDAHTEFRQDGKGRDKATFGDLQVGMKSVNVYALRQGSGGATTPRPSPTGTPSATPTPTRTPSVTPSATRTTTSGRTDGANERVLETTTPTITPTSTTTPTATPTPSTGRTPEWTAKGVQLPRLVKKYEQAIGEVTVLSDTSITIKGRDGKTHTGNLNSHTKKLPEGATFAVGDRVLIIARWDDDAGSKGDLVVWLIVKLGRSPTGTPTPTPTQVRS